MLGAGQQDRHSPFDLWTARQSARLDRRRWPESDSGNQPQTHGLRGRLGARVDLQLDQNCLRLILHGVRRDIEDRGNLAVGLALANPGQHLGLAGCQGWRSRQRLADLGGLGPHAAQQRGMHGGCREPEQSRLLGSGRMWQLVKAEERDMFAIHVKQAVRHDVVRPARVEGPQASRPVRSTITAQIKELRLPTLQPALQQERGAAPAQRRRGTQALVGKIGGHDGNRLHHLILNFAHAADKRAMRKGLEEVGLRPGDEIHIRAHPVQRLHGRNKRGVIETASGRTHPLHSTPFCALNWPSQYTSRFRIYTDLFTTCNKLPQNVANQYRLLDLALSRHGRIPGATRPLTCI